MLDTPCKIVALSFCAAIAFSIPSRAQDASDAAGAATPQSDSVTTPQNDTSASAEQPATSTPALLGQGNKAQAEHSAQATARKSVKDPNNQLGTSLQGRTRPVAGAENGPPYDTAAAEKSPDAGAQ